MFLLNFGSICFSAGRNVFVLCIVLSDHVINISFLTLATSLLRFHVNVLSVGKQDIQLLTAKFVLFMLKNYSHFCIAQWIHVKPFTLYLKDDDYDIHYALSVFILKLRNFNS